jgi:hypothetical protein
VCYCVAAAAAAAVAAIRSGGQFLCQIGAIKACFFELAMTLCAA